MRGMSYTARTMRWLREQGIIYDNAEKFNPHVGPFGIRQDLFGFIDIVALDPEHGIIAIQSTSGGCHSGHRKKILEDRTIRAMEWLECGKGRTKIWLISWTKKLLKRGGKARRWMPRIEEITLENFK